MSVSTWIKICGIKDANIARETLEWGADAIGLNFYPRSPRFIGTEAKARSIVAGLSNPEKVVGLFVNEPVERIAALCQSTDITTVQLHGDETPETLRELHELAPELKLIWARRVTADKLGDLADAFRDLKKLSVPLFACLLDAQVEGEYGGTGVTLPWKKINKGYRKSWPPLILAGGLTPDNVAEAIEMVKPFGVDVAGGVESSRGVKDRERIEQFIQNAR